MAKEKKIANVTKEVKTINLESDDNISIEPKFPTSISINTRLPGKSISDILNSEHPSNAFKTAKSILDIYKSATKISERFESYKSPNSINDILSTGSFASRSEVRDSFYDELQDERKKVRELQRTLEAERDFSAGDRELLAQWEKKEKIAHILGRISEDAGNVLLEDPEFQAQFEDGREVDAVVISIDIRRSTELMLKARTPLDYSTFITDLRGAMEAIILSNHGIFDKFTGDGILAFFPKYFSGEHAILWALKAAEECHEAFKTIYYERRSCFSIFIKDIGLGIGVDYGGVTLMNKKYELTVVGIPVVYACRMSGAPAGQTFLNGVASEELASLGDLIDLTESEIDIKNEGKALAYIPGKVKRSTDFALPDWYLKKLANETAAEDDSKEKDPKSDSKTAEK